MGLGAIAERIEFAELGVTDRDASNPQDFEDLEQLLDELDLPDEMDKYGNWRLGGRSVRAGVKTRNYITSESLPGLNSIKNLTNNGANAI